MLLQEGYKIMPVTGNAWVLDESQEFPCITNWDPLEWQQFQILVQQMERYGEAGGLAPEIIAIGSTTETFLFKYGINLYPLPDANGIKRNLTIEPGFNPRNFKEVLMTIGINSDEIPVFFSVALQKLNAEQNWGQLLGATFLGSETKPIVALDRSTLFYPYLGPSNFAHELGHVFSGSSSEDLPRQCEEAVLLGALKLEPVEHRSFIRTLLNQLQIRMGKN